MHRSDGYDRSVRRFNQRALNPARAAVCPHPGLKKRDKLIEQPFPGLDQQPSTQQTARGAGWKRHGHAFALSLQVFKLGHGCPEEAWHDGDLVGDVGTYSG